MNKWCFTYCLLFLFACQTNSEKTKQSDEIVEQSSSQAEAAVAENIVIAHRGMPYHCPESTVPSYLLAREIGSDYLEADLQMTKDSVIIVFHDDALTRTTNVMDVFPDRANDRINTFTFSELQQLDAGSWFNETYPERSMASYEGLKIISLEELIDIALQGKNKPGLYLETKKANLYPGIERELFDVLKENNWLDEEMKSNLILQTFEKSSLPLLNQYFPTTRKLFLLWKEEGTNEDSLRAWVSFGVKHGAQFVGPSIPGEIAHYPDLMEPWMVSIYQEAGLKIHAYTFDTQQDIEQYADKMSGCFTNRSDLLLTYRNREHAPVDSILNRLGY